MPAPSITILAVYLGPLPPWIDLWLASCRTNPDFHWLLIGDQLPTHAQLPPNVTLHPSSIADIVQRVQQHLNLTPALEKPYKICDLRPAFGLIFQDLLAQADFWGYCDIDVLWGNLGKFITPEVLQKYDKVFPRGHLSLIRNTPECNHWFQLPTPGIDYREIVTSPQNYIFDEWPGVQSILTHHNIPCYSPECIADIDYHKTTLQTTRHANYPRQAFIWQPTGTFRYYEDPTTRTLQNQEYAYIHFQKRKLTPAPHLQPGQPLAITPRGFLPLDSPPTSTSQLKKLNQPTLRDRQRVLQDILNHYRIRLGHWRRHLMRDQDA